MTQTQKILVAVDDSEASRHMLPVIADRVSANDNLDVVLYHLLPPLPPELLESRGAERPDEERRIEDRQAAQRQKWITEREGETRALMAEMAQALTTRGVPGERIHIAPTEPLDPHQELADAIVAKAKLLGCRTIAVGRHSSAAFGETMETHLGDVLAGRAGGLEVWIVE